MPRLQFALLVLASAVAVAAARPGDALGDALQRATPGIMYNGTQLRCPERVKFELVRACVRGARVLACLLTARLLHGT